MRKNGVIRGIERCDGGVCAPIGFTACGSENHLQGWEYALINCKERIPSAFVCTENAFKSTSLTFAQKRVSGALRAFAVLSGVTDGGRGESATYAKALCVSSGRALGVPEEDVLPIIIGKSERKLPPPDIKTILKNAKPLPNNSAAAARAISGADVSKECAFSFYLGDIRAKIGFIGRGASLSRAACSVALLTTDVRISSTLLQKALKAEEKDCFQMLCLPDLPSPFDVVCVMASGGADNYPITRETDTDYKKFAAAFHLACFEICKILARKTPNERLLLCQVKGVNSKQAAREIAKNILSSAVVKEKIATGKACVGSIFSSIGQAAKKIKIENVEILLSSQKEKLQIASEGKETAVSKTAMKNLLCGEEICLTVSVGKGNYAARALTTLP